MQVINIVSLPSIVGSVLIFLTTLWNPKLQQHPYQLISLIALIDASYITVFNSFEYICFAELPYLFTKTWYLPMFYLFGPIDSTFDNELYKLLSLELIITVANYLYTMLLLLSLALNTLMCIDLYLTVKNPFTKGSARTWYFSAIAFGTCVAVLILLFCSDRQDRLAIERVAILVYFGIFIIVSIFSLIFVARKLLKPGFSK